MTFDPAVVAARLAELSRLYVPETIDKTIARLECEHPEANRSAAVQHHIDELRALSTRTNV